jgi:hypothetical protein
MTDDATILADPVVFEFEVWERAWTSGVVLVRVDVWRGAERLSLDRELRNATAHRTIPRPAPPVLGEPRPLTRVFDRSR